MTAACPACIAADGIGEESLARGGDSVQLHLPDIHCAACISQVEEALARVPGVARARVNLTLRRASVEGAALSAPALVAALAAAGHRAQELDQSLLAGQGSEMRDLLMRTGVAGFAMMNVMLLSVAVWSGAADTTAQLFHLISAAITVPAIAFSGRPFFASALGALRHGRLNMDVPISIAIALAAGVSVAGALTGSDEHHWFDAALALTFFLLIGRCLDQAGRRAARSAAAELAALDVPQAVRLTAAGREVVKAERLTAGDLIELKPGDRFPADGQVETGRSDIDRSALNGESAPAPVAPGDAVQAGEVNLSGLLTVRVARAGRDTALSRLTDLVATAEAQRSRYSGVADRAARAYAPLVHILSAAAFVYWLWLTGDGWRALDVAIAVLVITCPCALGLAVPAVSTVATGRLFRRGLLVKSQTALERLAEIDAVAFDKTGTLTTGAARLTGTPDRAALALAAGLAAASRHPYSRAIRAAADSRGIAPRAVEDATEVPGRGVEARAAGRRVRLGHPGWLGCDGEGVALDDGQGTITRFAFEEELRPEAPALIAALKARGLDVALLSGDGPGAVAAAAARLGIDRAEGRMTPEDKAEWLAARGAEGRRVLMVGDGLNDSAALAGAHASLAPASGLEAARCLADVVLVGDDLGAVSDLLDTAKRSLGRMRQNILISVGYNLIAVPVALAGLASPFLAALAMSISSLTVTLNSVRAQK
ncbi:putative copper-transporting ATPase PacS [Roseivivax jejudonensis]|uniref:Putative copper-transporting ATPase PacS n=1 Tax=Roseivivax jejudonensis TaxID=1529041 RepID=A0A1X6ZBQ4_9RHOB|nr:heavy metal translocating P-type ATPase [Roseivivax jejudonensis]SLN46511.1 putative copper-transporting ATPase PacS [Roseivivax jejudonensis]